MVMMMMMMMMINDDDDDGIKAKYEKCITIHNITFLFYLTNLSVIRQLYSIKYCLDLDGSF
jgi:hypothetical protein